jgi:hypothetical protein
MKPVILFLSAFLFFACTNSEYDSSTPLPKVKEVDLTKIDLSDFAVEEWYMPYYLKNFAAVANSVADTGANRGYFNLSVWRGSQNHHTYNARIMEGILSLVWFYCTDRPWNPYYNDKALKKRIEASLSFWCSIQNDDGRFSEYRLGQWSLAPTAFATKFIGRSLWLLDKGPSIDKTVMEQSRAALRKALYVGFTSDELWQHGRNYTNQFANLWGGALLYLDVWPDTEIEKLLKERMEQSMTEFQSPVGFFYEKGGPDWGYNLNTHHSDLHAAWEFAEKFGFTEQIIKKTADWYHWFSYNAIKEPGSQMYYLNRAVETRQQKGFFMNTEIEDPAHQRWVPQAEFIPVARAFEMSRNEFERSNRNKYSQMLAKYPEVAELEVGEFNAFTPYAFLHHNMKMWHSDSLQKKSAIDNLPYLKNENFIHNRHDNRSQTNYLFIRKPLYYAIFNSGKIITEQQRYGIGLIWNPFLGSFFQSQSRTDKAAYGTKPSGSEKVYEAGNLFADFLYNGQKYVPDEGNTDLQPGSFELNYPLGETGSKTILFAENSIKVKVSHRGNFTEILPLLITSESELLVDKNQVKIKNNDGEVIIQISKNSQVQTFDFDTDLTQKKCRVVEISAGNQLEYEFVFY